MEGRIAGHAVLVERDGQVLRLEGIENHQLTGFSQQAPAISEKEALSLRGTIPCSVTSILMATSQ